MQKYDNCSVVRCTRDNLGHMYEHHNLFSVLKEEKKKLSQKITGKQDEGPRPGLINQHVIGAGLLGLGVSLFLASAFLFLTRNELQDHPQCGIVTDGKVSDTITGENEGREAVLHCVPTHPF